MLAGLGAGVAESLFVVIPTETIKTKIVHSTLLPNSIFPTSSTDSWSATKTLAQNGGFRAMYSGVSATLLRQAISSMVRFGTYTTLKNLVQGSARPGQKLPSGVTFGIGAIAGGATVCEYAVRQREEHLRLHLFRP
jgi:solute carrier family 25 citrate transporter 1